MGIARRELAPEDGTVVQAIGTLDPQLDALDLQADAAPVRRPRYRGRLRARGQGRGVGAERETQLGCTLPYLPDQRCPRRERRALVRGPGAELAAPGAGREVGVAFLRGRADRRALDADLPAERVPVEAGGGPRVVLELAGLARAVVGEKHEVTGVGHEVLAKHDTRRR